MIERTLLPAQERVARLVVQGLSYEEIADELGVAVTTVRTHVHGAFKRLGVTHRGELIGWWMTSPHQQAIAAERISSEHNVPIKTAEKMVRVVIEALRWT